jgi:hypothetical protein
VAEALDCYFTIERFARIRSPLSHGNTITREDVATIDALVDKLNENLTGVTAVRSRRNPSVVHLIEDDLSDLDQYVMDEKVTIKYMGTPYGLTDELQREFRGRVGPQLAGVTPAPPIDHVTQIDVDADNLRLRDVLANAVPLKGYNRIIWDAATKERKGGYYTGVNFFGPRVRAADGTLRFGLEP